MMTCLAGVGGVGRKYKIRGKWRVDFQIRVSEW